MEANGTHSVEWPFIEYIIYYILYIIEILKYTLCGFTILSCFSFIELLKSIAVCPVVAEITLWERFMLLG